MRSTFGSLVGVDVVTGSRRRVVPFAAVPTPERVRCLGVGSRLVCAAAPTSCSRPARSSGADGRVVLRLGGILVGVDTRTGERRRRTSLGLGLGHVFSDGRHLLLERVTPEDGATLLCLDLEDGHPVWTASLPEGSTGAVRLGAELYAAGGGHLVALR